ncbi:MAG TPA: hypothetical protein PL143_08530 [Rhodocyclaceae bacterium]|nr:hypothetical protein [Rhodocyclaceae bacterium]
MSRPSSNRSRHRARSPAAAFATSRMAIYLAFAAVLIDRVIQ